MTTPNRNIPYVPEGTLDPAAGLNLALNVIDALLQTRVISIGQSTPPGSPSDGDLYIVGAGATGAWAGHENDLARYVAEGNSWQFFSAGDEVAIVYNDDDGGLYIFSSGSWILAAGLGDAPADGDTYGRKDGSWVSVSNSAVVDVSNENTAATPGNAGQYTRFSHTAAKYTFDSSEDFVVGAEYHGRYVGSGTLTITEAGTMTINPPAGGSLVIPPGGTFTVKIVSANEADLIGFTVTA